MMASCARWGELSERRLLEEPLEEDELSFLSVHEGGCDACRREATLLRELRPSALHVVPTDAEVQRILAGADDAADDARLERSGAPARGARLLAAAAFLSLAASALLFSTSTGTKWGEPARAHATASTLTAPLLRTNADSCGALVEGVVVCLTAGSEVRRIELAGPQRGLHLSRGRALISITTAADGASLAISTSAGTVLGSGGVFSVEARSDGGAWARALAGVALVRRHDAPAQTLLAGQAVRLGEGSVTTISTEEKQHELELLERWKKVTQPAQP